MLKPSKSINVILLTAIVSIFVVIIFGVGGHDVCSENGISPLNVGLSIVNNTDSPDDIISEENKFSKYKEVLVAECAADFDIDTEVGLMFINYEIPDILPLCITEQYLDTNFNIAVASYGGYAPRGYSVMAINQPEAGVSGAVLINWIGPVSVLCQDPDQPCYGCYVDVYVADFILAEPIQLESNHVPLVGSQGIDLNWYCDSNTLPPDLGKPVTVGIVSVWEWGDGDDQQFLLILARIRCILETLQL